MNDVAKQRFDHLWAMTFEGPAEAGAPCARKLRKEDAEDLLGCGIIRVADDTPTRAWVNPFSVVEDKSSGKRRRFIVWPKSKNEGEHFVPDVPLRHVSLYLQSVTTSGAALYDLKASFYQIALHPAARAAFRMLGDDGNTYELLRLLMGYRISPELMQLLCSALAGVRSVVSPDFQASTSLHIDVWIDNIRICEDSEHVKHWCHQLEELAFAANVTFGEAEQWCEKYTFIGVLFDHGNQTVCIGEEVQR
eukprot:gene919-gene629